MEIFLSWSGQRSQEVAKALKEWLPKVIQSLDPWISVLDIEKGSRWLRDISKKLESTNFGILCLTPENLNKPWILFEAGSLSKALDSSHICPVLLDFDASFLKGPLSQFQATRLQKDDMLELMRTINKALGEGALADSRLDEAFSTWWPNIDKALHAIPDPKTKTSTERSEKDILEEILQIVRSLDRQSMAFEKDNRIASYTEKALATLSPRDEAILRMRFGIGNQEEMSVEEIAKELNTSSQTLSEDLQNAMRKLREPIIKAKGMKKGPLAD